MTRESIENELLQMEIGETRQTKCPNCGATHEDKFYLTKTGEGTGVYICHRASCGFKGRIGEYTQDYTPIKKAFRPRLFDTPTIALPAKVKEFLYNKYELQNYRGMRYVQETNQLVQALQTQGRSVWGYQLKYLDKIPPGKAKCDLYQYVNIPKIHYEPPIGQGRVVIVEDFLSAKKISKLAPVCAILGTHMTEDMLVDIYQRYTHLTLFLDYDAVDKAVKMKKEWECLFTIDVIINKEDPKDTPYRELERILL